MRRRLWLTQKDIWKLRIMLKVAKSLPLKPAKEGDGVYCCSLLDLFLMHRHIPSAPIVFSRVLRASKPAAPIKEKEAPELMQFTA